MNGDGFDDLILGAPNSTYVGYETGTASVISGATGGLLFTFFGYVGIDISFGTSVSSAGDVNGDGFDDVIVGAPFDDNSGSESGSARVFSGADGGVLATLIGDSEGDLFGGSVSCAGDVNGDGFDDLIVGAYGDDNNGDYSGSARIFISVIVDPPPPPLGRRLCADQNRDGLVVANDFAAWVMNFNAMSLFADVNQDRRLTPADFSAWIAAFNLGASGPRCTP